MEIVHQVKRQLKNIFTFRAYSLPTALKQMFLLPLDYYLRNGRSTNPISLTILPTLRCNLRCSMCNVISLVESQEEPDMNVEQLREFLNNLGSFRPGFVISGGEPFAHKQILEIIAVIKERNLSCGIFTNGTLLNPDIIKELVACKLDFIAFSLEGTEAVHNEIVGSPKAYEQLTGNLKYFCEHKGNTKVVIHSTISQANVNLLTEIAAIGDSLGVDAVRFGHLSCLSNEEVCKNAQAWEEKLDRDVQLINYIPEAELSTRDVISETTRAREAYPKLVCFAPELSEKEISTWYAGEFRSTRRCFFLWRSLFVYPSGDVYPCENFRAKMGNIFEQDFGDIWNSPEYLRLRQTIRKGLLPGCARCCKL